MTDGREDGTTEDSETTAGAMTDGREDGTTEDSETTAGAMIDDKEDGTTEDSETTEAAPSIRITTIGPVQNATTQTLHAERYAIVVKNPALRAVAEAIVETVAKVDGTAVDSKTIAEAMTEVGSDNSEAHSTTTIGPVQNARIPTSPSETCATGAKSLAPAEAVAEVAHEATTDGRVAETTTNAHPTGTDDRAGETTEDSKTIEVADRMVKTEATAVQPEVAGNGMDDLNDVLPTTTSGEQKGNAPGMRTIDHRVISGPHGSLSEKTNEGRCFGERRITLPQRPRSP